MKKLFVSIFLLIVAGFLVRPVHAQQTANVSAVAAPTTVTVGTPVTVSVNVANVVNFGAYEFTLLFDPTILQAQTTTIQRDDAFLGSTGNGGAINQLVNTINNTTGVAQLAVYTLSSNPGPSGSGRIATITFNTIGAGTSALPLSAVTISQIDGTEQPSTVTNGSLVVTPVASPVATPIATPNATPVATPLATPVATPEATPVPSGNAPGTMTVSFKFEGVAPAPGPDKRVTITFKKNGTVVQTTSVDAAAPDAQNVYTTLAFNAAALTESPYDVCVKGPTHLTRCFRGITITGPTFNLSRLDPVTDVLLTANAIDIPAEGALDKVFLSDWEVFRSTYAPDTQVVDAAADFNFDGVVSIFDFNYIPQNYNKTGDQ